MPAARGLYEVSREKMRTRHFAYRTEQAYLYWIRRYVNFHDRKHPREMGASEVEAFFTHLAVDGHVSASTQNRSLQALLFLYRQVLEIELPWLENVTRARRPKRLPVVLTPAEVRAVLAQLDGAPWLFANLLYGSGLRLMEALRLRVKDLVIERGELIVREAKGGKDRVTVLPTSVVEPLRVHLSTLLCNTPARSRLRYPHSAGITRPRRCALDDDLHPRPGKGCDGREKSLGPAAIAGLRFHLPMNSYAVAIFPIRRPIRDLPLFRVSSSAAILSAILVFSH
jgi:integrase